MGVTYSICEDVEKVELSYHGVQNHRFLCCIGVARGFFDIARNLYGNDKNNRLTYLAQKVEGFVLRDEEDCVSADGLDIPCYAAMADEHRNLMDLPWSEPVIDPRINAHWDISRIYVGLLSYCDHSDTDGFFSPGQCVDIVSMLGFVGHRFEATFAAATQNRKFLEHNPTGSVTDWRKTQNEIRALFAMATAESKSIRLS